MEKIGPDFLCIGAQKGGTSWLYRQLAAHPSFWMPPRKELHYFNARGHSPIPKAMRLRDARDQQFQETLHRLGQSEALDLPSYGGLFTHKGALLSGDITPAYGLLLEDTIELILRAFPKVKVIFLARDPVERAWSQLSMGVRSERMAAFDVTDPDEVTARLLLPMVRQRSYPSQIVRRWRRHVPAEQFACFFFDDLQRDSTGMSNAIIAFLGGEPTQADPEKGRPNKAKLPLSEPMRAHLGKFFAEELAACAAELGGAALTWPGRYA